jgi:hypothetical protein
MREVSRVGVLEGLSSGSVLGLFRIVMHVCQGVGCASAAHNYGYDVHLCAWRV